MADDERDDEPRSRRGLLGLLRGIPDLVRRLIHDEIRSAREEIAARLRAAAVGLGLTAAGAVLLLFGIGQLVGAGAEALHLLLPRWLADLIVGGALAVVAAILLLLGVRLLRRGVPPVPAETLASVKDDVRAATGRGLAEHADDDADDR
ncbi:phage holin family protein [Schumannella soli]|uniref:Phage holin family protein n=1 Tax=Schumannella soli TaxID=2590779 RepID=A0A506Y631_9MICO|nr:phage holin family protein [Schumannella soli]TPW77475.1 phage holin family protein [Schumannella soli]